MQYRAVEWEDERGDRYSSPDGGARLVPKPAGMVKPEVSPAFMIYRDGNRFVAVTGSFQNLQESPSGWGGTPMQALADLMKTPAIDPEAIRRGCADASDRVFGGWSAYPGAKQAENRAAILSAEPASSIKPFTVSSDEVVMLMRVVGVELVQSDGKPEAGA